MKAVATAMALVFIAECTMAGDAYLEDRGFVCFYLGVDVNPEDVIGAELQVSVYKVGDRWSAFFVVPVIFRIASLVIEILHGIEVFEEVVEVSFIHV